MKSERTNDAWLAGLRNGDEAVLEELRRALLSGLRRALADRPGAREADLEDLVQDALVRILGRLESFRGDSRFLTWAHSVAIRQSLTTLRRRHWQDVSIESLELPPRETTRADEPDAAAERADLLGALRRAIDTHLTERQRTVILAELAGLPGARLVEELGTNSNALYKLYHDARKKLRQALLDLGFSEDDVRSVTVGSS